MTAFAIFGKSKTYAMYEIIQPLHYWWAYGAFILLVLATINSLMGHLSKREFKAGDRKIALFGLIAVHTQLLIGLITWAVSPMGMKAMSQMSDSALRLTAVEHPLMGIIAAVLVTIGFSKHKSLEGAAKFKPLAIFYTIALVLVLSRIPWSLWF